MKVIHLDQAGPDWHKWRAQGIGGSDAPAILNESPFTSSDELAEVKAGKRVIRENDRMRRGKRLEPEARVRYMELTGIRVRPVCVVHDEHSWLRASLDGLSEDRTVVLEIKCPSNKTHEVALLGRVPHYYVAQCQHQLLVTGCPTLHYWSYTDSSYFPTEERIALVKVLPDPEFMERLFRREKAFWERLQQEGSAP